MGAVMTEPVTVSIEHARSEQPSWCLCDLKQLLLHNNTDSACRHEEMEALHFRIALLKTQLQIANDRLLDKIFDPLTGEANGKSVTENNR